MSLLQREKVDFAKQKTDEVSVISYFVAEKSEGLGAILLYFLIGISPVAYAEDRTLHDPGE